MDNDDPGRVVDAVDDPVVASPCGEEAGQLSDERLSELAGVLADRAPYGDESGVTNLGGKPVEVAQTFWGDTDFVLRPGGRSGARQGQQLAAGGLDS